MQPMTLALCCATFCKPSAHLLTCSASAGVQQPAAARSGSGAAPAGVGALDSLPQSLKDLQLGSEGQHRDGKEPVRAFVCSMSSAALSEPRRALDPLLSPQLDRDIDRVHATRAACPCLA